MINELKRDEGFRSTVYLDSKGKKTIGYGTKLPISKQEREAVEFDGIMLSKQQAEELLVMRLNRKKKILNNELRWLIYHPPEVKKILYNMAYQMGVKGVLGFKKTLAFIKNREYKKASIEMLDSKWYKEDTPNRAKRLSDKMAVVK